MLLKQCCTFMCDFSFSQQWGFVLLSFWLQYCVIFYMVTKFLEEYTACIIRVEVTHKLISAHYWFCINLKFLFNCGLLTYEILWIEVVFLPLRRRNIFLQNNSYYIPHFYYFLSSATHTAISRLLFINRPKLHLLFG